jgi:hypothetical protein
MNGYDMQFCLNLKQKCQYNNFTMEFSGHRLFIRNDKNLIMGTFEQIEYGYYFMCGYEEGMRSHNGCAVLKGE